MNKQQKRGWAVVIAVCVIFVLSACGRSGEISYHSSGTSAAPEPQSTVDAAGLDRAAENTGSVGDKSAPGVNVASAEESSGMESNANIGDTGSIGKAPAKTVTKTDDTGKIDTKPDDTAGSSGGTTTKTSEAADSLGATAKPSDSTGSAGETATKPNENTGSTGSTIKPDENTGSTGSAAKPGDDTGSTGGTTTELGDNKGNTGGPAAKPSDDETGSTGGITTEPSDNTSNSGSSADPGGDTGSIEEPAHTHSWVAVHEMVHHDEVGHYETVTVQEAYDEKVYARKQVCNACGAYFDTTDAVGEHILWDHDGRGSYSSKKVVVDTIHHEAVTEQRYVVDQPAYDEQVLVEYKCSCGETKKP